MKNLIERWEEVKKTATPVVDEGGASTVGYDGDMWAAFKASITPAEMTALEGQLPAKYQVKDALPKALEFRIIETRVVGKKKDFIHYRVWDTNAEFIITISLQEEQRFTRNFDYAGLSEWLRTLVQGYRDYKLTATEINYEWNDEGNCTKAVIVLQRGWGL